jgi:uncharacterized membrane protein (DUF4010 family)
MEQFQPFFLSALIGLLVGFERQKAAPDIEIALGVRSFLLIGLLGSLSAWIGNLWISILTSVFALTLIVVSYWLSAKTQETNEHLGVTTELAAGVVFLLGFGSHAAPTIVAFLGPLVALVLFSKKSLHEFTRRVRVEELQATLVIMLLGVGVVSLLPDRTIDPWAIFNPKKYGILVLILAVFEFGGYLAAKIFGQRKGFWLLGFLGGLASSTAMTLYCARSAKQKGNWPLYAGAALSAQLASLMQLLAIVYFVSHELVINVMAPIISASAVATLALLWCVRKSIQSEEQLEIKSPLDIKNVLRLSVLLGGIIFLFGFAKYFINENGIQLMAFLTGLFELHAISLGIATMFTQHAINLQVATQSVLFAVFASFSAKTTMSWIITRSKFAAFLTATFILMAVAAIATFYGLNASH